MRNVRPLKSIYVKYGVQSRRRSRLFGLQNWLAFIGKGYMISAGENTAQDCVTIMSIHKSKGLEFPVTFIAGAEEGLIPHARSVEENDGNVEEERRLFYVAITRAREKLLISACRNRRHMQMTRECEPSRFLDEIPANLVEYHTPSPELTAEKTHDLLSDTLKNFKLKLNS